MLLLLWALAAVAAGPLQLDLVQVVQLVQLLVLLVQLLHLWVMLVLLVLLVQLWTKAPSQSCSPKLFSSSSLLCLAWAWSLWWPRPPKLATHLL